MFSLTLYFQVECRQTLLGRLKKGLCEGGTCSTHGKNATRIQNFSQEMQRSWPASLSCMWGALELITGMLISP